MYKKISDENILTGSNFSLFIGVPITREEATGTINGSNKDFKVVGPVYPKAGLALLPDDADVTVDTLKGETWTTSVSVAAVKTGTDTATGDTIYNTIEMTAAPAEASVDKVHVNYVEEMQAMIAQGVDTTFSQEETEVTYLGSTSTMKSYGSISTSFKADLICSEATLRQLQQMSWTELDSQTGVDSGYTAYEPFSSPPSLYAYLNIEDSDGDVIGRIYCESVKIPPTLPSVKTGDNATVSLDITVGETPTMIMDDTI